jgi:hypothetical protein
MATYAIESRVPGRKDGASQVPRIPMDRYPLVHTYEGIDYEVFRVGRENQNVLRLRALDFERHFGYSDPFLVHDKVRSNVKAGTEVVFAVRRRNWQDLSAALGGRDTNHNRDIAIVTQDIRTVMVGGKEIKVVAPGIRVVKPDFQQGGIGRHLAEEAIIRHSPDFLVGKSRTVRIPRMYEQTGLISGIPPVTEALTDEEAVVVSHILDKRTIAATDLRTGIALGIYPPSESDRLLRPDNSSRGAEIYDSLVARGFNPERGDGFVYCAVVDHEAVKRKIDEGFLMRQGRPPFRIRALNRMIDAAEAIATRLPLL